MTSLRHFREDDAGVLRENLYSGMTEDEIRMLIDGWNRCEYRGRYFEMFAIVRDGEVAGTVSLYHHSKSAVSIGPEVFARFRKQGVGSAAVLAAAEKARERGYRLAVSQVRASNAASAALHNSLGFETDGYEYVNKKGEKVLIYFKLL